MANEGASVAIFDVVDVERGEAFAAGIHPQKVSYTKVDITDSDAVKIAVEGCIVRFGNLAGCVHCAGVAIKRPWTNDVAESIPNFKKVSIEGESDDRYYQDA